MTCFVKIKKKETKQLVFFKKKFYLVCDCVCFLFLFFVSGRRRSATQPPFAWRFCGDMKRDETTRMHKRKWEENERDEERKKCCNGARDASPLTIENLLKYSDFMHSKLFAPQRYI